ncbi:copper resistance protein B [Novosphingobium album (ex Hu et al. 2023)]|uniref:Copper resistance protein B n=1 Tax=Novosphingobium album (ex Hu et al. 2023) TaxID=2930093 RepID=A0ABT0B0E1_9SPHN|nr:copper resistance protein B [Novosphingobium album (ex Hu et al. 2023)]MCJ2178404.1 copper resistance protein B [Novosphingobium album (ex Hu et al. 2023)]
MRYLLALPLLAASPAFAQDQMDHAGHHQHTSAPTSADPSGSSTGTPGSVSSGDAMESPEAMDHSMMNGSMDHSGMDHMQMGHGMGMTHGSAAPMPAGDIPQAPPPAEAFSGPDFAADQFVGADVMAASRMHVVREASGMPVFWLMADRAEFHAHEGKDGYTWDVQGSYGGHIDKLWFKSEGEGNFGEKPERAEVQALWSHAIGPWWDLQAGVRQDLAGPSRAHAAIGVQGLAPYLFEMDAAAFISNKGDVTARVEGELDQRITQRLILQPRAEINLAAQDIPELGIGSGVDRIEAGLRLRYEIRREFAPYMGIAQEWKVGTSADYARASGEEASVTNFVVGVRFWF